MSKELEALTKIEPLLENLNDQEIVRILKWIADKYLQGPNTIDNQMANVTPSTAEISTISEKIVVQDTGAEKFPTLADLLSISQHKTEADRLLLAAYWYTSGNTNAPFHSNDLTGELKNAGYIIKKISNPIRSLKNRKPQYIIQAGKNLKTKGKNGRITYKITAAGIKAAEEAINDDTAKN